MDSNVELPLESKFFLEQVKRYIADIKDVDELRKLVLQAEEVTETTKYLSNLLVAEVLKNEAQWEQRLVAMEQKCATYEALFNRLQGF